MYQTPAYGTRYLSRPEGSKDLADKAKDLKKRIHMATHSEGFGLR